MARSDPTTPHDPPSPALPTLPTLPTLTQRQRLHRRPARRPSSSSSSSSTIPPARRSLAAIGIPDECDVLAAVLFFRRTRWLERQRARGRRMRLSASLCLDVVDLDGRSAEEEVAECHAECDDLSASSDTSDAESTDEEMGLLERDIEEIDTPPVMGFVHRAGSMPVDLLFLGSQFDD